MFYSAKSVYKYIYKGHDWENVEIKVNKDKHNQSKTTQTIVYDEITKYVSGRYVSAP